MGVLSWCPNWSTQGQQTAAHTFQWIRYCTINFLIWLHYVHNVAIMHFLITFEHDVLTINFYAAFLIKYGGVLVLPARAILPLLLNFTVLRLSHKFSMVCTVTVVGKLYMGILSRCSLLATGSYSMVV